VLYEESAAERGMDPKAYSAFLTENGISPEEFKDGLAREFVPADDVRAVLLAEQMASPEGVEVAEADIQQAYSERYGERIDVRRIILDSGARAEKVYNQTFEGANFELLVLTESKEPLVWMTRGLVKNITPKHPYYEKVKDLRVGELSAAFRKDGHYHLLKVVARHPPVEAPPIETVRERIREEVRQQKLSSRTVAWLEKHKAESSIEIQLK